MGRRHRYRDSQRKLDGNLCDITVAHLIELCRERKVTGVVHINSWGRSASLQFRAGELGEVSFGARRGQQALDELYRLRDGRFELAQRLPSVAGASRKSDRVSCSLENTPLEDIMQQCQNKALSCEISVTRDGRPIELTYRAGELARVDGAGDATLIGLPALHVGAAHIKALSLSDPPRPRSRPAPARRVRRSNPPPLPRRLAAPPPLRPAQHSLAGPPRAAQSRAPAAATQPATSHMTRRDTTQPRSGDGRDWTDPTWIHDSRAINWTYPAAPRAIPRIHFGNATLGLGLIGLTVLVGMMASHL